MSEYLKKVVFYKERAFTQEHFSDCMFAQTVANTSMIDLVIKRKEKYHLKIAAGNNEAGELNEYRIQNFKLIDWWTCSFPLVMYT